MTGPTTKRDREPHRQTKQRAAITERDYRSPTFGDPIASLAAACILAQRDFGGALSAEDVLRLRLMQPAAKPAKREKLPPVPGRERARQCYERKRQGHGPLMVEAAE